MTTLSTRRAFRTALITVALALASTVGAVSADVLVPARDIGAAGGGGNYGGQLDETARAQDLGALTGGTVAGDYDEVLAGSGYEKAAAQADAPAITASSDDSMTTATSSHQDVLAGSGYEQDDTSFAKTPNQRSIELSESKEAPGGILAGGTAPPRQVAHAESEHAQAQNASASAEQAPQASRPGVTAF